MVPSWTWRWTVAEGRVDNVRMDTAISGRPRDLEEHVRFEELLIELSSRFVHVGPDAVDREIENALRRVCEHLGIDVAVLWQWSADIPGLILPTHVHPVPEAGAPFDPLQQDSYPWVVKQMLAGRMVVVSRLDDLPAEAVTDLERARSSGIKSNLTLPLSAGAAAPIGALAFNVLREERDWPAALVLRLQLVAQLFTNALARKRADESLRESKTRLEAAAELAGLGFYELDYGRGASYFDNRFRDVCGVPPGLEGGLQVFEFWVEHLHPDDRPSIMDARQQLHEGHVDRICLEYRYLHPARGPQWYQHLARVAARDETWHTVKTYGVIRDITERKQADEALRRSYEEIERLTDRLRAESDYLKAEIKVVHAQDAITGKSAAIQKVLRQVEQVAPTNAAVIILGETGTGKEILAQAVHRLSPRARNVMVKVNCAALPSGLVESELFGREKGAFTGALARQVGRFEVADGSTLFLDEVGELPADVQVKLLRVLQEGEFERLGSPRTIRVNVRVIAATNRDLADEVRKGRFREDLYYRLNVFPIRMPPLRERPQDIPLLVWDFLAEFSARMGKRITQVPRATMETLQQHAWPGNVRELRNVIEHGVIITRGETLRIPMLDEAATGTAPLQTLADAEREHVLRVLERTRWRIKGPKGAAAALGLKPSTLYGRMKKLGIPLRREAEDANS
jgi:formate hydrogenlyase transcriptional activator